ncbi:MAG TPA: carboxypeptidase regulatory-like domain-containing protein [Candidatus Acidoferrales bacterium]|nr:carboxypeptidase regulatory-like domain-containing protein [Candidatus Acidoferrales bacterium]
MKKISLILIITALAGAFAATAADIIGTVTLNGTPPPEVPYTPLMNDSTCGAMYKTAPTTHFYVVGPNHELADVIVFLKGVTGKSTGASQPPVTLDQKGCLYTPQILAIQTGQKLVVRNSDSCIHNVHIVPDPQSGNPESNQVQMPGGPDLDFTFSKPEMFMKFKCDVHPWMFAWVSVFDSPYYCLSGANGKFVIKNVPPGKYTVEADHRKLGTRTQDVEVKDSDVTVNFAFDVK